MINSWFNPLFFVVEAEAEAEGDGEGEEVAVVVWVGVGVGDQATGTGANQINNNDLKVNKCRAGSIISDSKSRLLNCEFLIPDNVFITYFNPG